MTCETFVFLLRYTVHRAFTMLALPPVGSVSGSVFNDANHNGIRESSEVGIAGATVFADSNGNGSLDPGEISVTTDAAGNYVLPALPPDSYDLRIVLPTGWRLTTPVPSPLPIAAGQSVAAPAFGEVQVSTVPMDFNYLLTLAQHYGQPGTFATGDVNDDGSVNFADLLLVAQNYGHPLAAAAAVHGPDTADSLVSLRPLSRKRPRQ